MKNSSRSSTDDKAPEAIRKIALDALVSTAAQSFSVEELEYLSRHLEKAATRKWMAERGL